MTLLPWIWTVMITDMNRFQIDSFDVQSLAQTIDKFSSLIPDESILENLSAIFQNAEADPFDLMNELCIHALKYIPNEFFIPLANFYSVLLLNGDKFMKIPLYTVVTEMLKKYDVSDHLSEFTKTALADQKGTFRSYAEMYLNVLSNPNVNEIQSNQSTVFPQMEMFERIVAVNIPQLYEVNLSDDKIANFEDLNNFPPLIPSTPELAQIEPFTFAINSIHQLRSEPFSYYNDLLLKLHISLVDEDSLQIMKKFEKIKDIDTSSIFKSFISKLDNTHKDATEEVVKAVEGETQDSPLPVDPFGLIITSANEFVPTVDEVNCLGADYLDPSAIYEDEN